MKFPIITLAFTCTIITGSALATNAKPQRKRTSNNNHISVDTMKEEPYDPFMGLQPDAKNKIMESGGRWRMLQEEEGEEEGTEEPTAEEKIPTYTPTAGEKIPTYAPTAEEKIPTYTPTAGEKIPTYAPTAGDTDEPVTEAPVKAEVVATTMATTIAEEVETTVAPSEEEEVEVIETDMSFPSEEGESDEGTDIIAGAISAAESESANSGNSRALYIAPLVAVVVKTVCIATGFYMMA